MRSCAPHLPSTATTDRQYGRSTIAPAASGAQHGHGKHCFTRVAFRNANIVQVLTFAASCCGAATCSAVCSACGKCNNSVATRIAYALILLVNSIISWIMLTPWAIHKLEHLALDYVKFCDDEGSSCYGFVAVQRINFALGVFHTIMAIMLLGVRSSKDGRAPIQNGFWGPKIVAWVGLLVLTWFIPEQFFVFWGKYIAIIGACLFLLIGLVLLVDLAHHWAEYCQEQIETYESRTWMVLLVGSALTMYLGSLAMTIVMYIFFTGSGCSMNQSAITVSVTMNHVRSIELTVNRSTSSSSLSHPAFRFIPPSSPTTLALASLKAPW